MGANDRLLPHVLPKDVAGLATAGCLPIGRPGSLVELGRLLPLAGSALAPGAPLGVLGVAEPPEVTGVGSMDLRRRHNGDVDKLVTRARCAASGLRATRLGGCQHLLAGCPCLKTAGCGSFAAAPTP